MSAMYQVDATSRRVIQRVQIRYILHIKQHVIGQNAAAKQKMALLFPPLVFW